MSHIVSVAQLIHLQRAAEHGTGPAVRLLDVRWRLDRPEGRLEYLQAHLPGAVYVDLEHELARRGEPAEGRHPLPEADDLQRAARGWGLDDGDIVVAYDDNRSVPAARLWWLLRRAGVDVRVLDGGIRAWTAEGLPIERGDVLPAPGGITLKGGAGGVLALDQVEEFRDSGVLLDVRTPEQYSGARTATDPVGGHIPGAVNLPAMVAVSSDGRLQQPDVLRRIFATAGVDAGTEVAVYCGSGVAAMHTALALELSGIRALVYPGSWSQWSNTRGQPVAVGILPDGRLTQV
ncbi:sulfurtransferase [Microbacterium sp. AK031]|uniref:sulfurtransferase n=1 Tax=Microbacterium sp. AK031 TaxID=2723076 RepID=UPI0021682939|nr:sulfurtransferase [Microbacterium sp. AK031]MCS3843770.1 thiosulfate/3-mercaptopyruvate sulfurtransferase [Microbacterium sp. AK031]